MNFDPVPPRSSGAASSGGKDGKNSRPMMDFLTVHQQHLGWNNRQEPVLWCGPGELLEFDVPDASGGQIGPTSSHEDVLKLDPQLANPLVGPVHVDGAEPGDALEIDFLDFELGRWGWTAIIPGYGLLADDFRGPYLHVSEYDQSSVAFAPDIRVPTRPFAGSVGLAPAEPGVHSVIPPRRVGGNLDCRDLVRGSKLVLPVEVPGALLSLGDTHAAQGHGEVCGTAIETSLRVKVRVNLLKRVPLRFPRAQLPTALTPTGPTFATMGVGSDLMTACRDAVREMIDHLVAERGMAPEFAYCLCSVAGSLTINEVVNRPNWVVGMHLPHGIFR